MNILYEAIKGNDLAGVIKCLDTVPADMLPREKLDEGFKLALAMAFDDIADVLLDKLDQLDVATSTISKSINHESSEPIAVIGLGCRFPGGANNLEAYWKILRDGVDSISEVPSDRWNAAQYYDANPNTPDKISTRLGGFINRSIQDFDAMFFRISPREAEMMDPQQRLLLEVAWEALEHANIDPHQLRESLTGVFTGICSHDFGDLLAKVEKNSSESVHGMYAATGNAASAASGRISFFLGLEGPNLSIDTACSSSLVSIHQACRSLQNRESNLALACGVNVILSPDVSINFSKANMLSPDGHCKSFDEKANGYVRGEGCGVVILKRLSDALADNDYIHAVVRGSAVNQDGASSGLTTPNGPSQERLIKAALKQARLSAHDVNYVETHGTGTPLGDPIEVLALGHVYSEGRDVDDPLIIGTAKVNIGHLEGAAGMAGFIKTVLCLNKQMIPPHRNFEQLSSKINLTDAKAKIITKAAEWRRKNQSPRLAGVSSFGFSGTNAHVILSEAMDKPDLELKSHPRTAHLLTLSAKNPEALVGLIDDYVAHFRQHPNQRVADVCYTTNIARTDFDYRMAIVIPDQSENSDLERLLTERKQSISLRKIYQPQKKAFVFAGIGSVRASMCQNWYKQEPLFRKVFDECLDDFARILGNSFDKRLLKSILISAPLLKDIESNIKILAQPHNSQAALFSFEYAVASWWQSMGILPQTVMGHDVGEYVAAVIAGVMSLGDAMMLMVNNERLPQRFEKPQLHDQEGMIDYLEIGPKPNMDTPEQVPYQTVATLYEAGYKIMWQAYHDEFTLGERQKVQLPAYHFIRKRYWPKALESVNEVAKDVPIDCEVLIIGGGAAGLSALGRLKANGHQRVILIEKEDNIGGIWHTTKYPGVSIQSKNFSYKFFDFHAPKSAGEHATAKEIVDYCLEYIEHRQLKDHISLSRKVKRIVYYKDNLSNHRCSVWVENVATGEEYELKCNYVINALGFSSAGVINKPSFNGMNNFKGKVVHSSEFDQSMLDDITKNNKKVCILGAGKSAYDLALRVSESNPGNVMWVYDKFLWGLNYDFIYSATVEELRRVVGMYAEYESLYKVDRNSAETRKKARAIIETGYLINMEEGNVDIYQSRSAIYKPNELRQLKQNVMQCKARILALNQSDIELSDGSKQNADYLICATGYQHASNLPLITVSSGGVETEYDIREQPLLFRSMISPQLPHLLMFTGQTLFPQQLLIYSIAAEWVCRYIEGRLSGQYTSESMSNEIQQDINEHGMRYKWHPNSNANQSKGANYIIDSPYFYFKRLCNELNLPKSFCGDLGLAIANHGKFTELSGIMNRCLQRAPGENSSVMAIASGQMVESHQDFPAIETSKLSSREIKDIVRQRSMLALKKVLGMAPQDIIDENQGFDTMGVDSNMFIRLRGVLRNYKISIGDVFANTANLNEIVDFATEEMTTSVSKGFDKYAKRDFDRLSDAQRKAYYDEFSARHIFLKNMGFKNFLIKGENDLLTEVYASSGSGETIVLLPPLNCSTLAWMNQIAVLVKKYRVVTLHYPGYGKSEFNPDAVKIDAIADNIFDVLGTLLNNQPFHLVGWSYGGHVALPYAKKYSNTLLSLTLVCTTACLESMYQPKDSQVYSQIMQGLVEDFNRSNSVQPQDPNSIMGDIKNLKATYGIHTFMHYAIEVTQFDYRQFVDQITVPTLVIAGAEDKLTIPAYMKYIADKIRQSVYIELKDSGHYLPLFYPDFFNRHLLQHLSNSRAIANQNQSTVQVSSSNVTLFNSPHQINNACPKTPGLNHVNS